MKISPSFIVGIILSVAVTIYYGYLIVTGSRAEAVNQAPVAQSYSANLFNDPLFQEIQTLNLNGPLPLVVTPSELGKSNPY